MAAEYDFQRKPNPKGDGELQPLYPRIVNRGTITTKRLVSDISHASSFTPGDIEGLLAAFEDRISYYLSEGHHGIFLGRTGVPSGGGQEGDSCTEHILRQSTFSGIPWLS